MIDVQTLYPWFVTAISLLGAHLVSCKSKERRKAGFGVWILSNALIGYGYFEVGNMAQFCLFIIGYQYYNIRGILNNR